MNIRKDIQILTARTGVFFANCDGEYDKLEDRFISEFILQMIKDGIEIEDSLKELIDIKSEKCTIDDVINSTKELLNQVNADERQQVVDMLKDFIEKVINADGVVHSNEEKYFNQWKSEFCK
ncbi:MAG: TerB family tellurite resistance protein [Bacteroidales bacterium]|nr:TerB family tellurite resistance protein [Bacteroidales bacterium]